MKTIPWSKEWEARFEAVREMARIEASKKRFFSQKDGAIANRLRTFMGDKSSRRGYTTGPVGWDTRLVAALKFAYRAAWFEHIEPSGLSEFGLRALPFFEKALADVAAGTPDYSVGGDTELYWDVWVNHISYANRATFKFNLRDEFWALMLAQYPNPAWTAKSLYERDEALLRDWQAQQIATMRKATEALSAMGDGRELPEGAQIVTDGGIKSLEVDGVNIISALDIKAGSNKIQ